ncbi:biotin synthase BioB [Sanyastnella coralliicola]|uniref:biotin synthase BioB n=1 Tax=Sanyastnella coralliicola TaxID=3069118 RepID=UPI0027B89A98|nr:biotin synthase BioB [Longitalea sp. SCSIO 12813]
MKEARVWSREEIKELYDLPLIELIHKASTVHREHHAIDEVQVSTLLSIKTGGCPEDCGYCPQAARYHTGVDNEDLLGLDHVKAQALRAKSSGSSRLCLGAAWRNVKDDADFDHVLEMVRTVNETGLEVCATLGMLTEKQAKRLKDAGLYAYNHNLDSSEEYYKEIISTRGYEDRLETIDNARKAGMTVCSGGIIGMGESDDDRCGMLATYSAMDTPPESVPINALVAVEGTPLEDQETVSIWEMVRMIAVTRIVLPTSVVRLSAGRTEMSDEGQALCFLVGAGSIFAGDKLLTTPNPDVNKDMELFNLLGIKPMKPYSKGEQPEINEAYRNNDNPEKRIKWSRPGHAIERNLEKAGK